MKLSDLTKPNIPTFECVTCKETFSPPNWTCFDGQSPHVVAGKEYLLADAPTDPSSNHALRDGRTVICNIPPERRIPATDGTVTIVPGGSVLFIRGRYSTTNPEIQYYLDKKGGFVDEAAWTAAWLTEPQRLQMEKDKLADERRRLEHDRNELLEQVQRAGAKR